MGRRVTRYMLGCGCGHVTLDVRSLAREHRCPACRLYLVYANGDGGWNLACVLTVVSKMVRIQPKQNARAAESESAAQEGAKDK